MKTPLLVAAALLIAGCATKPSGPSVLVLPGSTKTFDQFRGDDQECRQYAGAQSGGAQQSYDHAYQQCMYGKGHQVPVARSASRPQKPAGASAAPPPPPGSPPPPPAGYRIN